MAFPFENKKNKIRLHSLSLSVYTKAVNISIETKCRGGRPSTFCANKLGGSFESEKTELHFHAVVLQPIVLVCFDIFKRHRGLKSVDKIKKYRCDIPRGLSLTLAVDCHRTLRVR